MHKAITSNWFRISSTVLLVFIVLLLMGIYGAKADIQAKVSAQNETISVKFQVGSTTEYRKFTKEDYIIYLQERVAERDALIESLKNENGRR